MKYRIGLDISGGDNAPVEILRGAHLAQKETGQHIVLIGREPEIKQEAQRLRIPLAGGFTVIHAPEKIEMAESPAVSVRRKKKSSIAIGVKLLKERKIDAFVSCGNTGAVVCASTLYLGMIKGVERPGIALMVPTERGVSLVIDVGANIGPKPMHLFQYGIMGGVYYQLVFDTPDPSVGLLNIGEEETKGSEFVKYVHKLFSSSPLNFIGNLEAKQLFSGNCECIVADGYIGNIALKVAESCAEVFGHFLKDSIRRDPFAQIGMLLARHSLKRFKRMIDYAEYGGAPLLGVDGVVIIGHGRSSARAVKNAVQAASRELNRGINSEIKRRVNEICQNCRAGETSSS
ncbi:MAG: phosphate acyltransferase PlsX [Candidatus Omnitrophica bacterium]|nr:phosphate acyltransferase PlsX [Candidatus Omnitrophota bacterium]